ncbi:DMT family transporter [Catenisphaera adipataccumulans]|uniref:Drug/metabolite transporter (DMT)-like permease n=1 Tax=Catenisphaera adipataccumulans TaxID=700500 RepID=A0A7W8FXK2_9FIRM|nr:DMT family transporter [Catenisphaera adipataccumulans]MBB5183052.1 drug/metabolite transporter (DMT)-like permease [Catenisphaera adipataccumulans]
MTQASHSWKHALLLVLTALIWGCAFVAQSVGADYVGPYTFLAARYLIAFLVLLPIAHHRADASKRRASIKAGLFCGVSLFLGSLFQQIGIAYTTTAKSGFITAMYMIIVPLLSVFLGQRIKPKVWLAVAMSCIGLYLLCIHGTMSFSFGDAITLVCSLFFALHILIINHFVKQADPWTLSAVQLLVCGVLAAFFMPTEAPTPHALYLALPAVLYAGVLSSAAGYTLQTFGQQGLDPAVASLIMCLESVFSALAGWVFLHQTLTPIEIFGCILMFFAIVWIQLPEPQKKAVRSV